ncbi:MAG: sister chromatid cohesion protein PDS5 [Candidatus Poribacteria bacterium]
MSKNILIALLNCSWQWSIIFVLTWFITARSRKSNIMLYALWFVALISFPILFGLNNIVPGISITGSQITNLFKNAEIRQRPDPMTNNLVIKSTETKTQNLMLSNVNTETTPSSGKSLFSTSGAQSSILKQFRLWADWLLCLWGLVIFGLVIRISLGLWRIRQLKFSAYAADHQYQDLCHRLCDQLNINQTVTLRISDQIDAPISFGWRFPHILIPKTTTLDQFELIAVHELAHIRRLDWPANLITQIIGAFFFFHPLFYLATQRLTEMRERICDDSVIQVTDHRTDYAQCLLDMTNSGNRQIPLALGLNHHKSKLQDRIKSIIEIDREIRLQPLKLSQIFGIILLFTLLPLLSTAQLVPVRTAQLLLFTQATDQRLSTNNISEAGKKVKDVKSTALPTPLLAAAKPVRGGTPKGKFRSPVKQNVNKEFLNHLSSTLQTAPEEIRLQIVTKVLDEIGESAVPILIAVLNDESAKVRNAAVDALGKIGESAEKAEPEIVSGLAKAATDESDKIRRNAIEELGDINSSSPEAISILIKGLGDQSKDIRLKSAATIMKIGLPAKSAVPALMNALGDESDSVRRKVMSALGEMGSLARSAVPKLIEASKDKSDKTRLTAIEALGSIGETEGSINNQITPILIDALTDENDDIRREAADELGDIGATSPQAISALIRRLHDDEGDVRDEVIESLGQIGKPALSELKKASIYGSDETNRMIVQVFIRIGLPAVTLLNEMMKNLSDQIRYEIIDALGDIGEDDPSAVASIEPILITALASQSEDIRRNATEELGDIKASSKDAIRVLSNVLLDPDKKIRRKAAEALGEIGQVAQIAVPALTNLLDDDSKGVRLEVVEALGKIGSPAQIVIPALVRMLGDSSDEVRDRAAKAIRQLSN